MGVVGVEGRGNDRGILEQWWWWLWQDLSFARGYSHTPQHGWSPPPASFSTPTPASPRFPLPSTVPRSTRQQLMLAGHSRVRTGLNRQPSVPLAHCWHTANWQHTRPKTHTASATLTPALSCCSTSVHTHMHVETHTHTTPGKLSFKAKIPVENKWMKTNNS